MSDPRRPSDAAAEPGVPLREVLREAERRLAEAGVPSPNVDARDLAAFVLGLSRSQLQLAVASARTLDEVALRRLEDLVSERARRVPLQHLTGEASFRHLVLAVGPGVFVPRPETEVVAEAAIEEARRAAAVRGRALVVDLATGSGAIALAVATEVAAAEVHAVEREPEALAWAERNVEAQLVALAAVGSAVHLHPGDLADAMALLERAPELAGAVDVVVSNPPYVPRDQVPIDPEVRDHDPAAALYGDGADGLDQVRAVARTAARLLRPGGLLVVEHAERQGASAPRAVRDAAGFDDVHDHADLTGRPRYVTARWSAS